MTIKLNHHYKQTDCINGHPVYLHQGNFYQVETTADDKVDDSEEYAAFIKAFHALVNKYGNDSAPVLKIEKWETHK